MSVSRLQKLLKPPPLTHTDFFPSSSIYSSPSESILMRIGRSRYSGSRFFSQRSDGSRIWPSASTTLVMLSEPLPFGYKSTNLHYLNTAELLRTDD